MKSLQYFIKTFLLFTILMGLAAWLTLAGFEGSFNLFKWSFEARDFYSAILICSMTGITIFAAFRILMDL